MPVRREAPPLNPLIYSAVLDREEPISRFPVGQRPAPIGVAEPWIKYVTLGWHFDRRP